MNQSFETAYKIAKGLEFLVNAGKLKKDNIPKPALRDLIERFAGSDNRTIEKFTKLLIKLEYIQVNDYGIIELVPFPQKPKTPKEILEELELEAKRNQNPKEPT